MFREFSKDMKLEEVITCWLPDKKRQVKESAFAAYCYTCSRVLLPAFGNLEVESIDKRKVREFAYEQLETKLPKTVKGYLMVLKMIMKYAAEEYNIAIPSLDWNIVWPSDNLNSHKIERYTTKQVKTILEYAFKNPSNSALALIIALTTGMRIGEICALKFSDIDFEESVIHVTKTVARIAHITNMEANSKISTKIVESTPKTKNSQRDVPIAPKVKKLLKAFMLISRPDYYVNSGSTKVIEPRTFRNNAAKLIRLSGVDHVLRFHALRHTFATTLIEQKVDPKTVSSILGHSDVSITLDLYIHPSEEAKKNAIAKGFKGII